MYLIFILALVVACWPLAVSSAIVEIKPGWRATSDYWSGERLAICVQPGEPDPKGRNIYWYEKKEFTEEQRRMLSVAGFYSPEKRREIALWAIGEGPRPEGIPLGRMRSDPVLMRSKTAQDLLFVDVWMSEYLVPTDPRVFNKSGTHTVPVPSSLALVALGLIGFAVSKSLES